jgi:hypothetical protein
MAYKLVFCVQLSLEPSSRLPLASTYITLPTRTAGCTLRSCDYRFSGVSSVLFIRDYDKGLLDLGHAAIDIKLCAGDIAGLIRRKK